MNHHQCRPNRQWSRRAHAWFVLSESPKLSKCWNRSRRSEICLRAGRLIPAFALATFVTRPQAEYQIGAASCLSKLLRLVKTFAQSNTEISQRTPSSVGALALSCDVIRPTRRCAFLATFANALLLAQRYQSYSAGGTMRRRRSVSMRLVSR